MADQKDILTILHGFQKYELKKIGNLFGAHLPARLKKAEMACSLAGYLSLEPEKWLSYMLERDLRLLQTLVRTGPETQLDVDFPDYLSVVEAIGLVDCEDDEEGDVHKVWLRQEVYDIVAPHVDKAVEDGEKTGRFEIERVCLGFMNLYGVMPYEDFISNVMDYYEANFGPHFDMLIYHLRHSPLLKLCRCPGPDGDEDYVCSPCVADSEEILKSRARYAEVKDYRRFTSEEALEAGSGAPYFTYGLKTRQGRALVGMLQSLGYHGEELVVAEHDIWINSQIADGNEEAEALFDAVTGRSDEIESAEQYYKCLQIIAAYANILPKWLLCGYSPVEKGYLRVVLKVDPEIENNPAWDRDERWEMLWPSLEKFDAVLPEGFPFGMAIPHVSSESLCPCGSGLQYRHCHGRNLN